MSVIYGVPTMENEIWNEEHEEQKPCLVNCEVNWKVLFKSIRTSVIFISAKIREGMPAVSYS